MGVTGWLEVVQDGGNPHWVCRALPENFSHGPHTQHTTRARQARNDRFDGFEFTPSEWGWNLVDKIG